MEKQALVTELRKEIARLQAELAESMAREQATKEAEMYYRSFFEHGTDGIVVLDPETTMPLEFNDKACQQLGYSREEFGRLKVQDIEAQETARIVRAHIDQILCAGFEEFDTLHRTKSGEIRNVHVQAQVFRVGKRSVYHCIWRDVTESKRLEDSLRESEDRFRLTFSSSPDAVTINRLDDGLYVDVNEGFTRITGYSREEVLGKSSLELGIWNDLEVRRRLVRELLKKGYSENLETTFRHKDGSMFEGLMSARVIMLNGVAHNIAVSRDMTQHKRHEKERLKIEKLESLGILAGGIAHDFNNVLTGIVGNLSFAKIFLDETHKAYKPLRDAEKAAVRAGELAHQLLTFARGGEPVKKIIDVRSLLEESLSLALHGSKVKSKATIAANLHSLMADEGQLSQVLHNIIINAIHAMPGGGELMVDAKNVVLAKGNQCSLPQGTYLRLALADQGCGIPQENLERIFDPYFTTKADGNGLGLASAYSIIIRHGGHIGVKSTVGKGTTFLIHLPSVGGTINPACDDRETRVASLPGEGSILVMDDEPMVREIASAFLAHLGWDFSVCDNGVDALALYKTMLESGRPFRAVFMDLTIPGGMGGRETAEQILSIHPEAFLVVSSGYSNDPVLSNFRDYGFQAAIAKPYTVQEFQLILNSVANGNNTGANRSVQQNDQNGK